MTSTIFSIPLLFFMITSLLLSIILPGYVYGIDDERYSSCSSSFNCGEFKGIGYPFWTNDYPEHCGHPGFKLGNCEEPNVVMDTVPWKYRVIEIHPETQNLKLARIDMLGSICPKTFLNYTLDEKLFSYTNNNEYATLWYNCDLTEDLVDNEFPCAIDNIPREAYFNGNRSALSSDVTRLGCNITLLMPVLVISVQGFLDKSLSIYQVINKGFEVRWNLYAAQCKDCINSGGKCGYNRTSDAFSCFCPDEAYSRICRSPQLPPPTSMQDGPADAPASDNVKGMHT